MKKPRKGEAWASSSDNSDWLVTDVAKKTKKDEYRYCDEDWNEQPIGTNFVYYVHCTINSTTQSRSPMDFFLENFRYLKKGYKCTCPSCGKWHYNFKNGKKI